MLPFESILTRSFLGPNTLVALPILQNRTQQSDTLLLILQNQNGDLDTLLFDLQNKSCDSPTTLSGLQNQNRMFLRIRSYSKTLLRCRNGFASSAKSKPGSYFFNEIEKMQHWIAIAVLRMLRSNS